MTIAEFVKFRSQYAELIISKLKNIQKTTQNYYLNKLIQRTKQRLSYLRSDNNINFGFYYTFSVNYYYHTDITSFIKINLILTAEKFKIVCCLCGIIEVLMMDMQNKEKCETEFLENLFNDNFLSIFRDLKKQLVDDVKQLQKTIHRPDMDRYTLAMIESGLSVFHFLYNDFTNLDKEADNIQMHDEIHELEKEIRNLIRKIESMEQQSKKKLHQEISMSVDTRFAIKWITESLKYDSLSKQQQENAKFVETPPVLKRKSELFNNSKKIKF